MDMMRPGLVDERRARDIVGHLWVLCGCDA
jgi:hypothetical protein